MTTDSEWEPSVARPGNPLRRFNADLESIGWRDGVVEGTGRKFRTVQFNFINLEVLEAVEVYPFPVTQIEVGYADPTQSKGGTRWAAFSASVRQVLGEEANVKGLVGKRQQWAMLPAILRTRDAETGDWGDTEQPCWQLVSVGSATQVGGSPVAGSSPARQVDVDQMLLDLVDGKTEKEFNEAALAADWVRADPVVVDSVVKRSILPTLETAGKISKDADGVWHKA